MTNVERRHGAPDTRPLPRAERRTGAVDTRESEKPYRSVYRVNYYVAGQIVSAFVCAFTAHEAVSFLGVVDDSSTVSNVAHPVQVEGVDKKHDLLPAMPIFKAPPYVAKGLSEDEVAKVRSVFLKEKSTAYSGVERRHGAPDTRPLPRAERRISTAPIPNAYPGPERRHGAVDTRPLPRAERRTTA